MLAEDTKSKKTKQDGIVDVDLSDVRKQRFRINIDDNYDRENNILELNISDLGIVNRMNTAYLQLKDFEKESGELIQEIANLKDIAEDSEDSEEETERQLSIASKNLTAIDNKMRELIDYVFDANVSEVCAPFGSMYDPINGSFRYEYILSKIMNLYEDGLRREMGKIRQNVADTAKKYVKKK